MKWVLWILLILTLCAIVAGLAVLVTVAFMPRGGAVGQRPAVTVQLATFTPRPTLVARANRTATRVAKAAPAITASPSALPATALPPTALPVATSTPPPATATPVARETATRTATAMPTLAATSVLTPTEMATVAPTEVATPSQVPTEGAAPSEAPTQMATPSAAPTDAAAPAKAPTEAETPPAEAPADAGTPGPTPSPYPIRPGWVDHAAAGFSLALPERWNAVDVSEERTQGILDRLSEIDNTWAENQADMYTADSPLGTLQFWAMDSRALGPSHATVTVVTRELTQTTTLRELAPQISATLRESRMQTLSTRYGLQINGLEAARLTMRGRMDPVTVQQYVYVYLRENVAWVVTYTVDWRYWGSFEPMFASSARSFRAD